MKRHTMIMLACKVDEHDLLYWVEYKKNSYTRQSTSSKNMYYKYLSSTAFSSTTNYHVATLKYCYTNTTTMVLTSS
jgi:hypothetical protein